MARLATIELFNENLQFSVAHFTVFSASERENLHGHNFQIHASFTTLIENEGLSFDYNFYKKKLRTLCDSLDKVVLLAGHCKHLTITEEKDYYHVHFNSEKIIFLKRDVKILPITNLTVEELSNWLLGQLLLDKEELEKHRLQEITVKIFSSPGQGGYSQWKRNHG